MCFAYPPCKSFLRASLNTETLTLYLKPLSSLEVTPRAPARARA